MNNRMSPVERRTSAALASSVCWLAGPVFFDPAVFAGLAEQLPGGESHALIGLALGTYGLTQALLQLPFGMALGPPWAQARDLFRPGAVRAGQPDCRGFARYLLGYCRSQYPGAGAINAAVTALLADLTREEHRTKAMAMIGGSIGLTFAASLVLGPALYSLISIPGIFALTGVLALVAVAVVRYVVPDPQISSFHSDAETAPARLKGVLRNPELRRLNFGIFALHVVQMAMFVVVPLALRETGGLDANHHWQVYLPVLAVSVAFMIPLILYGESAPGSSRFLSPRLRSCWRRNSSSCRRLEISGASSWR